MRLLVRISIDIHERILRPVRRRHPRQACLYPSCLSNTYKNHSTTLSRPSGFDTGLISTTNCFTNTSHVRLLGHCHRLRQFQHRLRRSSLIGMQPVEVIDGTRRSDQRLRCIRDVFRDQRVRRVAALSRSRSRMPFSSQPATIKISRPLRCDRSRTLAREKTQRPKAPAVCCAFRVSTNSQAHPECAQKRGVRRRNSLRLRKVRTQGERKRGSPVAFAITLPQNPLRNIWRSSVAENAAAPTAPRNAAIPANHRNHPRLHSPCLFSLRASGVYHEPLELIGRSTRARL